MTDILDQISKVLTEAGIEHDYDRLLKAPESSKAYYCIQKNKKINFFAHVLKNNHLHAVVRKTKPPSRIKELYGIEGKIYPKDYPAHYLLFVPIIKGLINGRYSILQKKDFFIDIARER